MHQPLKPLNFVTATILLCMAATLPLNFAKSSVLATPINQNQRTQEAEQLNHEGSQQYRQGQFQAALVTF